VDLRPVLQDIRRLPDLMRLVAALGHEPLWENVPLPPCRFSPHSRTGPTVVGRHGQFPWLATSSADPERAARTLARRWASRGRPAGVLALDTEGHRLAVAIAFEAVPCVIVDLASPERVALGCLARLAGGADGALAYAVRAADALAGESVGRRFFAEFRTALERMAAGLPGRARSEDRRTYALLQLTRVLFLYFVQAKGWLNGRERFLAEAVDQCLARRRRLQRDLLRPLFFGTLNRAPCERSRTAATFGAIPFLNGGLFEPHPVERRLRGEIPNDVWRDAFDRLFERFHFTVVEGASDGRIAPDMLGRVFEGVMAPDLRRASGTYYTPSALVRGMLDTAFAAFLSRRLECSQAEAERRLAEPDRKARDALQALTLLDPAAGSGAFLLGALERLAGPSSTTRRAVLQHNLFGVDRSAAAVRLTELRLWLAVIADDQAERPEQVQPLPNLDCLVRQGDSLFEPVAYRAGLGTVDPELAARLAESRRLVVASSGGDKRARVRHLVELEAQVCSMSLTQTEEHLSAAVDDLVRGARARDLFGERRGLDRVARSRLRELRRELHAVRRARRTVAREREVPWFQYQCHFADVFARGGFDLVVGNPPWLRAEEVPEDTRRRLSGRYRWWRAAGGSYANRPDLAVAFLERAFELAAPAGVVAFVVPAKLATAAYGASVRHGLATSTTLLRVADLRGRPEAAFDATVYPLALVARNSPPPPAHRVATSLAGGTGSGVRQSGLVGGAPWILSREPLRAALAAMARDHPPLSELVRCHLGLKTGANKVFLTPPKQVEAEVLRLAVRGRDVRQFRVESRVVLLYTHDASGAPRRTLPPAATAYLKRHRELLRSRADYAGGVPWALFRVAPATAAHRVIWSDLARELTAAALTGPGDDRLVPLNTCYVAVLPSARSADCLAAWLNSTWLRATARAGGVPAASGFARFSAGTVGRLPLPPGVLGDSSLAAIAADARRGGSFQSELDDLTARYLDLSSAARNALQRLVSPRSEDRG
jgi:hypothetical protein